MSLPGLATFHPTTLIQLVAIISLIATMSRVLDRRLSVHSRRQPGPWEAESCVGLLPPPELFTGHVRGLLKAGQVLLIILALQRINQVVMGIKKVLDGVTLPLVHHHDGNWHLLFLSSQHSLNREIFEDIR